MRWLYGGQRQTPISGWLPAMDLFPVREERRIYGDPIMLDGSSGVLLLGRLRSVVEWWDSASISDAAGLAVCSSSSSNSNTTTKQTNQTTRSSDC